MPVAVQYSTPECLALGGNGRFAMHVDAELLRVRGVKGTMFCLAKGHGRQGPGPFLSTE